MRTTAVLVTIAVHLRMVTSFAIPPNDVHLSTRESNATDQDPIEIEVKCKGVERACEAEAVAIICYNAPHTISVEDAIKAQGFAVEMLATIHNGVDFRDGVAEKLGIPSDRTMVEFARKSTGGVQILVSKQAILDYRHKIIMPALKEVAKARNVKVKSLGDKRFIQKWSELSSSTPRTAALMSVYDKLLKAKSPQETSEIYKPIFDQNCLTQDQDDIVNNAYMSTEKPVPVLGKPGKSEKTETVEDISRPYFHHMKPGRDRMEAGQKTWPIDPKTGKDTLFDPEIEKTQKKYGLLVGVEAKEKIQSKKGSG